MTPQELRASIIQQAIQGKLVEQRPEEGTGEELFQQIQAKKQALIKAGKIKKEKPLPEIAEDEIPFDIPEAWRWVRVASVVSILNGDRGKNYPSKDKLSHEGIPFISAVNLDGKTVLENENLLCLTEEQYEKLGNGKLVQGDIVVCIRGSLGKHGRYPFSKGAIASSLVIMRQFLENEVMADYLMMYLDAPLFFAEIRKYDNGTAQPNLAAKSFEQFLVPLPPLAEQKRIVAKLEEILPLIDRYEAAWIKLEEFNKRFPGDMQKSILQLAIQGKLVEQRPEEGTGEELFQQIQAEKEALIKAGKIKKEKPLPEIAEDEIPFDIPDGWKWIRVGDVFNVGTGMTPLKTESRFFQGGTIPWVTSSLTSQRYIQTAENYVTEYAMENTSLVLYPANTLLIAMYGQGKTRGQVSQLLIDATINQACAALGNIITDKWLIAYVYYFFLFNYEVLRKKAEGTSQPNLNLSKIKEMLLPLPSLAEQKRIVAKLEEILPLCDRLK